MTPTPRKPRRRLTALGLAIVASLAFAGIAAGSASALSISPTPIAFTGSGGANSSSSQVYCNTSALTGASQSGSTGGLTMQMTGCKLKVGPFNLTCTTSGQASGTIQTANLKYRLVYLDAEKTQFGLMLIPPDASYWPGTENPLVGTGVFAKFSCAGGNSIEWNGTAITGISEPALNVPSTTALLHFGPAYHQVEGMGNIRLSENRNGSKSEVDLYLTNGITFSEEEVATFLP